MSEYENSQESISSAGDSLVKTSPTQEKESESSEPVPVFGASLLASSERFTQRGSLRKMFLPFALKDLPWSYKISTRSGMMRNGIVFPLPPLVRLTRGTGFGLWPTTTATDHTGRGYQKANGRIYLSLPGAVGKAECGHYQTPLNGKLNPTWVEWLMGFPEGWTALEPSETP